MTTKSTASSIACLLGGIIIGLVIPNQRTEDSSSRASLDPEKPSSNSPRAGSGRSLEMRKVDRNREGANTPSDLTNNQFQVEVPISLLSELSIAASKRIAGQDLFSRDGKVEAALGITDKEKELIQTVWRESGQKIRDLESASMVSEEVEGGALKVTVPDLSQSMSSVGGDFRATVQEVLGSNRAEAFLAIKQIDSVFVTSAESRTYTISPEPKGDGKVRFHMVLEDSRGKRVWVGERIPHELRHLIGDARIESSQTP